MPFILLDSTTLGVLTHPARKSEHVFCREWAKKMVKGGVHVFVPEITDYEIRRELLRADKIEGLKNLDRLGQMGIIYLPLKPGMMRKAAELWAWARKTNQSTAAADRIDIDVILAAQAVIVALETGEKTVVATNNIKDIKRYTDAEKWQNITLELMLNKTVKKNKEMLGVRRIR